MASIIEPKWEIFVKVAQIGSLTRAAASLDCPQSVLSRQIAQLEQQCGNRLFRRTGRGVVLTDFGELVYGRIVPLLKESAQLSEDIRSVGGTPIGEVRVGLLPTMVQSMAGRLYRTLRERFPLIKLHLTEGASAHLEEWLQEGRLDLALLLREDGRERADEPCLAEIPLCLAGPPGDPLTRRKKVPFAALAGLPLILPAEPHLLRARLNRLAKEHGIALNIAMEADSVRLQHELVAAGGGYAIVAASTTRDEVRAGRISASPIVDPKLVRRIVLGNTRHRPHTLATREVARTLTQMKALLDPPA